MGEYLMVLWPAGSPIPKDGPPVTISEPEPDVPKLGGRVIEKLKNERVIFLPTQAAAQLRRNKAVAYLQRIWRGEPTAAWSESMPSAGGTSARHRVAAQESDTNLQWGPQAYTYDGSGNIKQIGSDSYVYDTADRLIKATVDGKVETYQYDAFGNLLQKEVDGANPVNIPVDGATNRIAGVAYDAAGNVTAAEDGRRTYQYDAAGALTRVQQSGYNRRMIYDANDERIGMIVMNGTQEDTLSRWQMRDFEGHVIREYKGSMLSIWTWEQDYFYGENALVGGETLKWGYDCGTDGYCWGGRRHYHLDHLGSVRLVTDATTAGHPHSISEHEYYPFGATITRTYQEPVNWSDPHIDSMRFAGHWRDFLGQLNVDNTEYLDYMHARYYDPNLGRFLSVDPVVGKPAEPKSWNRYAYVQNNPIRAIDPDGRDLFIVVTNEDVGDTHVNKYPHGDVPSTGQVADTVAAYRVVIMNESGSVNTDFSVSRDTNATGPANWARGRYGKNQETPPGTYYGRFKTSKSLGDVVALSDKPGGDTIQTPDGYTKSFVYIHKGAGCSEGCFLVPGGASRMTQFLQTMRTQLAQDAAAGKGQTIRVIVQPRNSRECSSDHCNAD